MCTNDDVAGRDSVGSAKIDLKKHDFGKGRFDQWIKLPAMMGLRSKGELHVIMEHHVMHLSSFLNLTMMFFLCSSHETIIVERTSLMYHFNHLVNLAQQYYLNIRFENICSPFRNTLF
jgi:hypothetical protein